MASKYDAQFSPDAGKDAVVQYIDFRPTTLLEESLNGGSRVNKPVGMPITAPSEYQTAGGARIHDAIVAEQIGATGRKNQTK